MAAGRPKATTVPLVGFDGWSKVVREPLIWLGEQDPVSSMEAARAADPQRAAAHELVRHWENCIGIGAAVTARAVISTANETRFPKFRAFLIEHVGTMKADQVDPVRLGKWLHKEHGRVYGGFRIDIVAHKGRGNQYVLTKIQE